MPSLKIFLTTLLLLSFSYLLASGSALAASAFVIAEHFNGSADNWTFQPGISAENSTLTAYTLFANNAAYRPFDTSVPSGDRWRLDSRILMPAAMPGSDSSTGFFYVGVSTGPVGLWGEYAPRGNWRAIGLSRDHGLAGFDGADYYTLIPPEDIHWGSAYIISLASDGRRLTYSVSDDDGSNVKIADGPMPWGPLNDTFVDWINPGRQGTGGVDWLAFTNTWDGYRDPRFATPLRAVVYPDSITPAQRGYIELPKGYDNSTKNKACMYFSGLHNSSAIDDLLLQPEENQLLQSLSDQNYVLLVSDSHGPSWGNVSALRDYARLLDYARYKLNLAPQVDLLGRGEGGLASLNYALNDPGSVAAIGEIDPVTDLDRLYYSPDTPSDTRRSIDSAYGCNESTYATIAKDWNPQNQTVFLTAFPLRVWESTDGSAVGADQSGAFVQALNDHGGNGTLVRPKLDVTMSGGTFDPASVVAFFDQVPEHQPVHLDRSRPPATPVPSPTPVAEKLQSPVLTSLNNLLSALENLLK